MPPTPASRASATTVAAAMLAVSTANMVYWPSGDGTPGVWSPVTPYVTGSSSAAAAPAAAAAAPPTGEPLPPSPPKRGAWIKTKDSIKYDVFEGDVRIK